MALIFEWDREKERLNKQLHGVAFLEERFVIVGRSAQDRLLAVMFTERKEDRVRIFSARRVTARETKSYEEDYL